MFGRPMRRGAGSTMIAALAALVLVGCGAAQRQDASAPSGNFPVQITSASFPSSQRLSEHTHLILSIRNAGRRPIPDLTVTICNVTCRFPAPVGEGTSVAPFAQYFNIPGVAWHSRPVWVVDQPPGGDGYSAAEGGAGGDATADANSWQRGAPLAPGATATFDWAVTAVAPGRFVVAWEVAADQCGSTPCGTFAVTISNAPAQSYVNDNGQVVPQQ